jgi:hypothetical protein
MEVVYNACFIVLTVSVPPGPTSFEMGNRQTVHWLIGTAGYGPGPSSSSVQYRRILSPRYVGLVSFSFPASIGRGMITDSR